MASDLLAPAALAPLLVGTVFADPAHIHHFSLISSTNTAALQAAAGGAPEGTIFIAEEQTAGRGRGDHSWHSEALAGIYMSVILRPKLEPSDALLISLAAGLAVRSAVKQVTGLSADLKWPNDVLLADPTQPSVKKKFCGILAEMSSESTRVRYVVVGLGLNANHTKFPVELAHRATSLRLASGHTWPRVEIAAAILRALDVEYAALQAGTADTRHELIRRFEAHSSMVHERFIHVVDSDSNADADPAHQRSPITGSTAGLDEHGFLLVRTKWGVRTVMSGSIEFRD